MLRRAGEIHRQFAVGHFHLGIARIEAFGIRRDDVGAHRPRRQRVTRCDSGGCRHETTARQRRHLGQADGVGGPKFFCRHVDSPLG